MNVQRNRDKEGNRKHDGCKLRVATTRIAKAPRRGAHKRRSAAAAVHKLGPGFFADGAGSRRFAAGDLVLAKFLNWPMWPAILKTTPENGSIIVKVLFVGDRTTACIPLSNVRPYDPSVAIKIKFPDGKVEMKQKEDIAMAEAACLLVQWTPSE